MAAEPLTRPPDLERADQRQADISERAGASVRLRPEIGVFAAAAGSRTALTGLECGPDGLWFLEVDEVAPPPGLIVHHIAACVHMVADRIDAPALRFAVEALGDADAPEIFALARLTEPGPFFAHTNRMGHFIGVKQDGRLFAMAGGRLQPAGFYRSQRGLHASRPSRAWLCEQ